MQSLVPGSISNYRNLLLLVAVVFLLQNCTLQKRRYQKGFYVSHKTKKKESLAGYSDPGTLADGADMRSAQVTEVYRNDHTPAHATANQSPPPLKRKAVYFAGDSCDVMMMHSGEEIRVKVLEINSREIRYKKCSQPDGPLFISMKSEVFMIKYANGSKDVFEETAEATRSHSEQASETTPKLQTHPMAVLSLVFGMLGFIYGLTSIPAIAVGIIALRRITDEPQRYTGRGLAIAGIVLGSVLLLLMLILILMLLSAFGSWFI